MKNQAKLTMISLLIFLPSIMLSGIMFPVDLLPRFLEIIGKAFPAAWGYELISNGGFDTQLFIPLAVIFAVAVFICGARLSRISSE